jgi:enoyl-CoA hydratase/carnithine racemase
MAPPLWVHRLMLNAVGPRRSALAMQKGQMFNHHECLEVGLVDKIVPDAELHDQAIKEVEKYLTFPYVARADAKLKSVENVISQFTEKALDDVVSSISGPEFQTTVKGILASLGKKK